jgi:hypothetical protein
MYSECNTHGRDESAYSILVGELERYIPLGRQRRRLEDNIRLDLRGIRWEGVVWMHLVQNRGQWRVLVNMAMKLWVP